jgi:hypothetical protein
MGDGFSSHESRRRPYDRGALQAQAVPLSGDARSSKLPDTPKGVKYLRHRIFVLGVACVAALASTAGALATGHFPGIVGEDGTVEACYQKQTGELRAVSDVGECRPSERPLEWNVQGSPGPQGERGPQGEPGPAGEPGTALAYASVRSWALQPARTMNVAGMVRAAGSLYCFSLAFEPRNVVVQGEGVFSSTNAAVPSAIIPAPSSGTWTCPEGYRSAAVHSPMDRNFYVLFN